MTKCKYIKENKLYFTGIVLFLVLIISLIFSDIGLHPDSGDSYSLYSNFFGITKISVDDFIDNNKDRLYNIPCISYCDFKFYEYDHTDEKQEVKYTPYAFNNNNEAHVSVCLTKTYKPYTTTYGTHVYEHSRELNMDCLINRQGYIIEVKRGAFCNE